jgi:hypothetical protein
VAGLWLHNAHVAASEFSHAHETVALRIALFGFFTTATAKYIAGEGKGNWFTKVFVERY